MSEMCFSILTQYIVACDQAAYDINDDRKLPRVDDMREGPMFFSCHR